MNIKDLINTDPEIFGGHPVFMGTRVPVKSLCDHLKAGISLDEFLDDFPTVSKEQAIAVLKIANTFLISKNVATLYENAA